MLFSLMSKNGLDHHVSPFLFCTHKTRQAVNPQLDTEIRLCVNYLEALLSALHHSAKTGIHKAVKSNGAAWIPAFSERTRGKQSLTYAQIIHICKYFFMSEK